MDVNLDGPFPSASRFRTVRLLADEEFAKRFRPRVVSTTLALAWVAAGRRAAYVTDGDLRDSVHYASGIALCKAAGCVVTDIQGATGRHRRRRAGRGGRPRNPRKLGRDHRKAVRSQRRCIVDAGLAA